MGGGGGGVRGEGSIKSVRSNGVSVLSRSCYLIKQYTLSNKILKESNRTLLACKIEHLLIFEKTSSWKHSEYIEQDAVGANICARYTRRV